VVGVADAKYHIVDVASLTKFTQKYGHNSLIQWKINLNTHIRLILVDSGLQLVPIGPELNVDLVDRTAIG